MYGSYQTIRQPSLPSSTPTQWSGGSVGGNYSTGAQVPQPGNGSTYAGGRAPGLPGSGDPAYGLPGFKSAPRTVDPNAQYPSWTYQAQNPTAPYGPGYSTSTPPMAIQPTYPPASSPSVPPGSAVTPQPGTPSVGNPYQPYTPPSVAPPQMTTYALGEEGGGAPASIPPGSQVRHPFDIAYPGVNYAAGQPGYRNDGTPFREKGSMRDPNAEAWRTQGTPGTDNYREAMLQAAENRQRANAVRHDQRAAGNSRAAYLRSQPSVGIPPGSVPMGGPYGGYPNLGAWIGSGTHPFLPPGSSMGGGAGGNLQAILSSLLQ